MSVPTTEVPVVTTPVVPAVVTPPAPPAPSTDALPDDLGAAGKAAIDRMKAERDEAVREAKSLRPAATELAALKEAQLTNEQRATALAATAERERDESRAETLRYKAAATHQVGGEYVDWLTAPADEAAINDRALRIGTLVREHADLKAEVEALRAGKPAPANARPTENLKPGATPENNKTEDDQTYEALFGAPA